MTVAPPHARLVLASVVFGLVAASSSAFGQAPVVPQIDPGVIQSQNRQNELRVRRQVETPIVRSPVGVSLSHRPANETSLRRKRERLSASAPLRRASRKIPKRNVSPTTSRR